jgi:serine phosphatase RsbU (regulator of sigma subunit)
VKTLQPQEILFREGDRGDIFYVVTKGVIEVLLGWGGADEMLLNLVGEGEYLGEMGLLLPGGNRTATTRAQGEVSLLCMSRAHFLELTKKHPELSTAMVNVLSQRLDAANTQSFRDLSEKNKQLQTAYDELKAAQAQLIEKERMERELQVAADIQLSILPDELPITAEVDFGGCMVPARQVGGDFYDVFRLSEDKIGVVIGDVADKGVPSAIFMARAHALIMAEADMNMSPGDVMQAVNCHITRLQKTTQFVTVLYGILDLKTREFDYARAGHEPPLILYANGTVERLSYSPGMALGLWEDVKLDLHSITLPEGSTLLLFTDGMTDCRDPQGEVFGLERIKQELAGLHHYNAQQTCDHLLNTLKAYQQGAKQDDDVTLVAIHTLGEQSTRRLRTK